MRTLILIILLFLTGKNIYAQQQAFKTKPLIWLRADFSGDSSNRWDDFSGNAFHAYTRTGENKPDTLLFNYNRAFYFGNMNHGLHIKYYPWSKGKITVFAVFYPDTIQEEYGIWCLNFDLYNQIKLSTQHLKTIRKNKKYADSTMMIPVINSISQNWKNQTADSSYCGIIVGGTDSLDFRGKLAEFLLFETILPVNELKKVNTYFAIKYGITLKEMDYTDSKSNIIWNYKQNIDYNNSVAGIGSDSLLGIFQKQSSGTGGMDELKIACGKLHLNNSENPSSINNGDFIIWGHNGQYLNNIDNDTFSIDKVHFLSDRIWKIHFSGATSHQIPLQVIFDGNMIDSAGIIMLAVNHGQEVNFIQDSTNLYFPDSVDNNKLYYFSNISWDSDSTGYDYFTFQVLPQSMLFSLKPNGRNINQKDNLTEDFEEKIKFNVFPNPARDVVTIEIFIPDTMKALITISDIAGKIVGEKELVICGNYSYTQSLPENGCYVITLQAGTIRKTQRIVIKK